MGTPRIPASAHGDLVPARSEAPDPAAVEAPPELVPARYSGPWRALFGFVGIALAFVAVVLVVVGDDLLAAAAACGGGIMGFFAVTGQRPASDLLLGIPVAFALLLAVLFLFRDNYEFGLGLIFAAVGASTLVIGYLKADENDELPPASSAFLQLTDPKQPLPPPTSPSQPGEPLDHSADSSA